MGQQQRDPYFVVKEEVEDTVRRRSVSLRSHATHCPLTASILPHAAARRAKQILTVGQPPSHSSRAADA